MRITRAWVGAGLAVPVFAEAGARAIFGGPSDSPRAAVTAAAACAVAAGLLLEPAGDRQKRALWTRTIWCIAVGACAVVLADVHSRGDVDARALALSGAATAVLVFALCAARRLATSVSGPTGGALFTAVLGLAISAPIWMAPVLEASGGGRALDAAVAVSPVSYLAAMSGHDYLREQWLYTHSVAGSLRFAYPGRIAASAAWTILGLLCMIAEDRFVGAALSRHPGSPEPP